MKKYKGGNSVVEKDFTKKKIVEQTVNKGIN